MVDFKRQDAPDRQTIAAYGDGGFRINGRHWTQPVLVQPRLTLPWIVTSLSAAALGSFQPLLEAEQRVELLLIGCGAEIAMVPRDLRAALKQHGIVVEPMSTGAACRTYNLLVMEGRAAAAALLPI